MWRQLKRIAYGVVAVAGICSIVGLFSLGEYILGEADFKFWLGSLAAFMGIVSALWAIGFAIEWEIANSSS